MCGGAEARRGFLSLVAAFLFCCLLPAAELNDGVDRSDPNFVKASLLVVGPGNELYGCAGHVAFRLECPTFKHDYAFSYEGEPVQGQVFRFFAGKLKMGMFCIPTEKFLAQYAESGRGCRQYALDLSPAAKIRLWKTFDDLTLKGADLPYDYIKRGCAQSTLQTLLKAIRPERIELGEWPKSFSRSRREILDSYISDSPWTCLLLHMLTGPAGDEAPTREHKVITPDDLVVYLQHVRVEDRPILTAPPVELLPQTLKRTACPVSPMMFACVFVLLAGVGLFKFRTAVVRILLGVQTLIGLLETYVVFISNVPASSWNWLLIPFNPLPLVFWKWRRHWALPYAVILSVWSACMVLAPHKLTDSALCLLVVSLIVMYCALACKVFTVRGVRK